MLFDMCTMITLLCILFFRLALAELHFSLCILMMYAMFMISYDVSVLYMLY